MRHGEAEGFTGHSFKSDNERKLTEQGQLEAQLMAAWLLKKNINFNHIFVSPFVRAQQTCAQLFKVLDFEAITLDFITPSGDAVQVHDFIDGLIAAQEEQKVAVNESIAIDKSLLIVSHMPLISYLVSEFTHGAHSPIFTTAGIAEINYDTTKMRGKFVRMVSPSDLY